MWALTGDRALPVGPACVSTTEPFSEENVNASMNRRSDLEASDGVQHKSRTQETVVWVLEPPCDVVRPRALHLTVPLKPCSVTLSADAGFQNDSNVSLKKTKNIDVC